MIVPAKQSPLPLASDQIDTIARTLWAEARSEGAVGMQAVACVIINRMKHPRWWGGPDAISVCRAPAQFTCWSTAAANARNHAAMLAVTAADPLFRTALDIAADALAGRLKDITGGADSYLVWNMPNKPAWATRNRPVARIGGHEFYRLELGPPIG